MVHLPRDSTMSLLIINRQWNEPLIRNTCLPDIAQEILNITLSYNNVSNYRFWMFDLTGQYSVWGGYRLGIGFHDPPENQSKSNEIQNWWQTLCSLSIPPKTRNFWWKAYHYIITAAQNLVKHHVPASSWCPLCHNSEDSNFDALLDFPIVQAPGKTMQYGDD